MKKFGITILLASLLASTPASAQSADVDKRVDRLEQEMRAVQRKIFPGGSTRYFEPEITAENGPASPAASVTTSAVSDLIARVDALERSLANLTGQVEENGFRLKKLEDRMAAAAAPAAMLPAAGVSGSPPKSTPAPATEAAPDPQRVVGVAAIVMPETGDAGEDAYIYGYRLWDAKFYPEAQAQLKKWSRIIRPTGARVSPRICSAAPIWTMGSRRWLRLLSMKITRNGHAANVRRTVSIS
ncbi:hypothetical protein [Sphingopyxis sp. BSNA05]|uniref:hypothetical protein n=1 Tax=Sphingopyxis sp. BSNA05 TaxID=1236614 RepID=UPI0020B74A6C|nr:hypothetical protein [Sphingopyxis sp. BSNA05]